VSVITPARLERQDRRARLTDTKHDLTADETRSGRFATTEVDEQTESHGEQADTEEDENL
jgi:hypothetical protein